ncbi:hypothetical protein TNCV_4037871 [Trichonephila clavipes]|nr:hypothetical protein TNCV_4037871 [Trichonephila clavipes]
MKATTFTVNGDRYRTTITNFFIPELNNHDVQSCGSNKTAQHVTQLGHNRFIEKDAFGDRLISRFGPVNWPPRLVI